MPDRRGPVTPPAVTLEPAFPADAGTLARLERAPDTAAFILPSSEREHRAAIVDPAIVYLRILSAGRLAGFMILAPDPDGESVEFRRIVVADKGRGVGQAAIRAMERYCVDTLARHRIWLDVFDFNARGRHIYEKLGYRQRPGAVAGNGLLVYEKSLEP